MTVAELIARLQQMPQDMNVEIYGDGQTTADSVEIEKCYTGKYDPETKKGIYVDCVVIT